MNHDQVGAEQDSEGADAPAVADLQDLRLAREVHIG